MSDCAYAPQQTLPRGSYLINPDHPKSEGLDKSSNGFRFDGIPMVLETIDESIWPEEIALLNKMSLKIKW